MTRTTLLATACLLLLSGDLSAVFAGGPVHVVRPDRIADARQPQAASDGKGQLYVTYGSNNDIYCSVSSDAGQTFADPVLVGSVKHLSLGMRRGPRITVSGDAVVITAIGGDLGGGKDGDLLAWRSTDHGTTFHGPVRINGVPGSAREGLHAMASGPSGELYAVWLDLRSKGTKIYGAASRDGGANWEKNTLVYRSPSGSVCECCHPSVAYDKSGTIHVMWRNSISGNRDLYHSVSKNYGRAFSEAQQLGSEHWTLDACPMDGGAIAALSDGTIATVWRRNKDIFFTRGSEEHYLSTGEQPWAAADENNAYFVWISRRPGELYLTGLGWDRPQKITSNALDPVVTVHGSFLIACWESRTQNGSQIFAAQVQRSGKQ